jgi:arylsulfatase A-like enzyme
MNIKRKLLLCIILLSGTVYCSKAQQANQKPNILFLFADDWSWPHAGVYGDAVVNTSTFDSLAHAGMLFTHAFCASPSCSPSRAAVLTGQYPHRLEAGSQLWGTLPKKFPTYTSLLEKAGYFVGSFQKGYGPGNIYAGGYQHNPAGKRYKSFAAFLEEVKPGQPFCFWYGSHDPHRPYKKGSGKKAGMDPAKVNVPPWLPDVPEVRSDLLDYYVEVERFDNNCSKVLSLLKQKGLLKNTLVVISGDNGKPFPRAKANVYDGGTHIPLAVVWRGKIKAGSVNKSFVNLADLAPTFLQIAGLSIPKEMTAHSLLPILLGDKPETDRSRVYLEIERHAYARKGNVGYPMRAIRTKNFLYIRNFEPERWPAGDPELVFSVGPFGDCDPSPSKDFILSHRSLHIDNNASAPTYFQLAFGKRPKEELYDLNKDPNQMHNVAGEEKYKMILLSFRQQLQNWMWKTDDPRAFHPHTDIFNHYPYYGGGHKR